MRERTSHRNLARRAIIAVAAGLTLVATAALTDRTEFLDLPLGAYFAGQLAMLGVALFAVRIAPGEAEGGQSQSRSADISGTSAGGVG